MVNIGIEKHQALVYEGGGTYMLVPNLLSRNAG